MTARGVQSRGMYISSARDPFQTMAYRSFTDSQGRPWRVWDIRPTPVDRRFAIRRVRVVRIHHPDRRVLPDRRVDMRRSRLFFSPDEKPWLLFESGSARRRLHPAPEHWVLADDAALEDLCSRAEERG